MTGLRRLMTPTAALALLATSAPALAAPAVAGLCELHVWGAGYPNRPPFTPKSNMLVKVQPAPVYDPADPLAPANLYGTAKRAAAFSDDLLKTLFPVGTEVAIVRHDQLVDLDRQPLSSVRAPLAAGEPKICYADLVVANVYALYTGRGGAAGIIPALAAGGSRMVVDLWFQQYRSGDAKPFVVHRKNDGPLPAITTSAELPTAVKRAGDSVLSDFAETVAKKRER